LIRKTTIFLFRENSISSQCKEFSSLPVLKNLLFPGTVKQ